MSRTVPEAPFIGTGLRKGAVGICTMLGFINLALSSKEKSCIYYHGLDLANGLLLHIMLFKLRVILVKAASWLYGLMLS